MHLIDNNWLGFITDRVSQGKANGIVCLSVRQFVFSLFLNRLTFEFEFLSVCACMCVFVGVAGVRLHVDTTAYVF